MKRIYDERIYRCRSLLIIYQTPSANQPLPNQSFFWFFTGLNCAIIIPIVALILYELANMPLKFLIKSNSKHDGIRSVKLRYSFKSETFSPAMMFIFDFFLKVLLQVVRIVIRMCVYMCVFYKFLSDVSTLRVRRRTVIKIDRIIAKIWLMYFFSNVWPAFYFANNTTHTYASSLIHQT